MTKPLDADVINRAGGAIALGVALDAMPSSNWDTDFVSVSSGEFSGTPITTANHPQALTTALAAGVNATLIYQFGPDTDLDNADVLLWKSGDAGTQVRLNTDGGIYAQPLTAGASGTTHLYWKFAIISAYVDVKFVLAPGIIDDATRNPATAALSLLANQGGEWWGETDKLILFPSDWYGVEGRDVTLFGNRLLQKRNRLERMDLWLSAAANYNEAKPPLVVPAKPEIRFNTDQLVGTSFDLALRDPSNNTTQSKLNRRRSNWHLASASQTGTLKWVYVSDSLGNDVVRCLHYRLAASGASPDAYGTITEDVDLSGSTLNIKHESHAGWATSDYIGRTRPASNPFLKTASADDKTNYPTMCFSDDASYGTAGVRPSYAEDNNDASYSIFSWETWRAAQVGLATSDVLHAVIKLGRNDFGSYDVTQAGQVFMVQDFFRTFADGHIYIDSENNGSNFTGRRRWTSQSLPLAKLKLDLFDNNKADHFDSGVLSQIHLLCSWAYMNGDTGYPTTVDSTDDGTGCTTESVTDDVHPRVETSTLGSEGYQQIAEATFPAMLYFHENP